MLLSVPVARAGVGVSVTTGWFGWGRNRATRADITLVVKTSNIRKTKTAPIPTTMRLTPSHSKLLILSLQITWIELIGCMFVAIAVLISNV